jgi:hypothetical protein
VRTLRRWGAGVHELRKVIEGLASESVAIKESAKSALVKATKEGIANAAAAGDGVATVELREVKNAFEKALFDALMEVAEAHGDLTVSLDRRILKGFHGATAGVRGTLTDTNLPLLVASIAQKRDRIYDVPDAEVMERILQPYIRLYKTMPSPRHRGATDISASAEADLNLLQLDMALRRRGRLDVSRMGACDPEWICGPDLDWDEVRRVLPRPLRNSISAQDWNDSVAILEKRNLGKCLVVNGKKENLLGLHLAIRFGWRGYEGAATGLSNL